MKKTRTEKLENLKTKKLFIRIAVLLGVFLVIFVLPKLIDSEEGFFKDVNDALDLAFGSAENGGFSVTVPKLITLVCVLAIVFAVYYILNLILAKIYRRGNRSASIAGLLSGILQYVSVIAGIMWGLAVFGVNAASLFASVGVLALVIGFGAQSLIEDVITGVFLIFEEQYNVGDYIILDDFRGEVVKIGVRTTSICDAGGNIKVVNNSDIRNFQNRSKELSVAITDIGIAYEQDISVLPAIFEEEFKEVYSRYKQIFREAPAYLGVQSFGDSSVNLRFIVKVREKDVFSAQRALNYEVKLILDRHKITIPFPQVVVHDAQKEQ